MALHGSRELKRRLKAIRTVFKPVGKSWAEETASLARSRVKVRTGRTKRTIRVKNASMKKAAVEAREGARFLEAGAKPHEMKARKMQAMTIGSGAAGLPRFAKKVHHPGARKQPFMHESARDALQRTPMAEELIELWNKAA